MLKCSKYHSKFAQNFQEFLGIFNNIQISGVFSNFQVFLVFSCQEFLETSGIWKKYKEVEIFRSF
jgi:hypothetical protein